MNYPKMPAVALFAVLAAVMVSSSAHAGTLTATVAGSVQPIPLLQSSLTNGGFVVTNLTSDAPLGDGINEATLWEFDYSGDSALPAFLSTNLLSSAILTLTLSAKPDVHTDNFFLGSLSNRIFAAEITNTPVGVTRTVHIDLLQHVGAETLLAELSASAGHLPVLYGDDALISYARLDLTQCEATTNAPVVATVPALGIAWMAECGTTYQVEWTSEVNTNLWINLGESVVGTGATHYAFDVVNGPPRRFYRVVRLPLASEP